MRPGLIRKGKENWGYTLTEMLVVVAILAVISAIAIPSVFMIRRAMIFRQRNDYAKSIFLAAQSQLTQMRSSGELKRLPEDEAALAQSGEDMGVPPEGYVYTHQGGGNFETILPAGSVDAAIRDDQIIIEYNPRTGNVYAVFYYEGGENIAAAYAAGRLPRGEDVRRELELGYYDGSDLAASDLGVYYVEAEVIFENGQEGIVTVQIPTQTRPSDGSFQNIFDNGSFDSYVTGLEVDLIITGEHGGTFTRNIKKAGESGAYVTAPGEGGVNMIQFTCLLDSLTDGGSFANMASGENPIAPGDNVSITAEVSFTPGSDDPIVIIESAAIAGVNPMFASLTDSGDGGYILAVANGRNLQNLNVLAPEIAGQVAAVVFTAGEAHNSGKHEGHIIDWNETVTYYNEKYGMGGGYANSAAEAPDRQLPYFVPIRNAYLFGTAEFDSDSMTLVATDQRSDNADIIGNGAMIYNLNIDTTDHPDCNFTGLFGYVNTKVDGLYVVNPIIRAGSAAGALIGAAGEKTYLRNCGVYLDTGADDFVRGNLNLDSFTGEESQYGVSGCGAVGGLVGYAEFADTKNPNFTNCFAAVPVFGVMEGQNHGVGGLIGCAQTSIFANCYASGYVGALGCVAVEKDSAASGFTADGTGSAGAGGFVGSSYGSIYLNCFASGNVSGDGESVGAFAGVLCYDSISGQKTRLLRCYAVGSAGDVSKGFSGVNAVIGAAPASGSSFSEDCYYLSGYFAAEENSNDATRLCAAPATYSELKNLFGEADGWGRVSAEHTHAYDGFHGAYPFSMLDGMAYYGSWPAKPSQVGIAYYETYAGGTGYYFDRESTSTLQAEVVKSDGYVILSASDTITVNGKTYTSSGKETVTLGDDAYHVFALTEEMLGEAAANGFHSKVTVTANGESYMMYVNLNTALSQINPMDEERAAAEPTDIPGEIIIRSARQLAALGSDAMASLRGETYVQQLDIHFAAYEFTKMPVLEIEDFSGTYTGRSAVDGGSVWVSGQESAIFDTIGAAGSVSDLTINPAANSAAAGLLANTNEGTIENVTVNVSGTVSVTGGLLVGTNTGTVRNCRVNVNGSVSSSGMMGNNAGTVTDSCVTGTGSLSGSGFVGTNSGTIENCWVSPVFGTDYAGSGRANGSLIIKGSGFAATNASGGTITGCRVLGTVAGTAGFAGSNGGMVSGCMANVDMTGGYAFAEANHGTIQNSYGWVSGTAVLETENSRSSYFAHMEERSAVLFTSDGTRKAYNLDALADATALQELNGESGSWSAGSAMDAYPYSESLKAYPFPMICDHYGDWSVGDSAFSYGVLYYEQYSDGSWGVDMYDLSGAEDLPGVESLNTGVVAVEQAGYALYCRTGMEPFSAETNGMLGSLLDMDGLYRAANLSRLYSFYELTAADGEITVTVAGAAEEGESAKSVTLIPYYADTIDQQGGSLKIRTQIQLENIRLCSNETFEIDHNLFLDSTYTPIAVFGGRLTAAEGVKIEVSGIRGGLVDRLEGTLDHIRVHAGSAEFAGTKGVLANTVDGGTVSNCHVHVDITAAEGSTVGTITGELVRGAVRDSTAGGSVKASGTGNALGGAVGSVAAGEATNVTCTSAVTGGDGYVGMFAGSISGGTFSNCKVTADSGRLRFAGFVQEIGSIPVHEQATHYGPEMLPDGKYEYSALNSLTKLSEAETPDKPVYAATFENCTFIRSGEEMPVFGIDRYYYQVTDTGYEADTAPACKLMEVEVNFGELHDGAADWTATEYFVRAEGENGYHRLYVQVTAKSETVWMYDFRFRVNGETEETAWVYLDSAETENLAETCAFPSYSIYAVSDVPTAGTYLLETADGDILTVENGSIVLSEKTAETILTASLWTAGTDGVWTNLGTDGQAITVRLTADTFADERVFVEVTCQAASDGTDAKEVTYLCQPYEVTGYSVVRYVDVSYGLTP